MSLGSSSMPNSSAYEDILNGLESSDILDYDDNLD